MPADSSALMTEEEFELLKNLIHREFGILLKGDKRLTLHTRISHRLKILGLASYKDYYNFIMSDNSGRELYALASHITNKETYFFRETSQLEAFSEILKEIKREKLRKDINTLRFMSFPCASGEEAYTLNILLQESGLFVWNWDIKITGIDIDKNVLKKAQEACYTNNSFRMNGNMELRNKYFTADRELYFLRQSLRKNVEFRHGNIIDSSSLAGLEGFDVIFCRNVLIYMSDDAIQKAVSNLYQMLSDTGYLFLGASESLIKRTDKFVPEFVNGIIVYRKNVKN